MELDFIVAEKLGMSVARLRQELSNAELVEWYVHLGRRAQHQELQWRG